GAAAQPGAAARTDLAVPPRLLVEDDGLAALPRVLSALLAGGGIVGPASAVTARQAEDEGLTAGR
ncbi:MAG: TIGR03089 family protein, partial [Dermabacteraceae bacterium]|nr:hypothetical protein [Brachybacterium sp.]